MTNMTNGRAKLPLPSKGTEEAWRNWFDRATEISGRQFSTDDIDDVDDITIRDEMVVLPYEDQSPQTSFQTMQPD